MIKNLLCVYRHGNEDEHVHKDINVMQQLKSDLHCKKMIFSKMIFTFLKRLEVGEIW